MPPRTLQLLVDEFTSLLGHKLLLPTDYSDALTRLCEHLDAHQLRTPAERRRHLFAHINRKFRFNNSPIATVYSHAASAGITFNYHQKTTIQLAFDTRDATLFQRVLAHKHLTPHLANDLLALFRPIPELETLNQFNAEVARPSHLRRAQGTRPIDRDILLSALSAFVYSAADEKILHAHFDPRHSDDAYERSYWLYLRNLFPHLYARHRTLDIVHLHSHGTDDYERLRNRLFGFIQTSYDALANHGHLAIWIDPIRDDNSIRTWELASDAMLFAEKHRDTIIAARYFRSNQIARITKEYIKGVQDNDTRFHIASDGFAYRDTFVCPPRADASAGTESLLLLFQKNQADDTPIPCPACRSADVRRNSYSTLGVRSWECGNHLCPQRTKYNRGKRYSFKALLMQEAINNPANTISEESVRSWSLDVQPGRLVHDAINMLIPHYSLRGDGVALFGFDGTVTPHGRLVTYCSPIADTKDESVARFFESSWFARYIVDSSMSKTGGVPRRTKTSIGRFSLVHGDARSVLHTFPKEYFDGAVTSPPYYNARPYAQWANIYCYLHDMYGIARECSRVLKKGAPYLYNVFDYFDNERSIVFSAMGVKRLILSAYTVDVFRRAGFMFLGSVAWDKGDIEGKRGYNTGNYAPYYQSPFNCWEHVLVFCKPPVEALSIQSRLPAILRAQPVVKMVKGKNIHGHSAPFPEDIPLLLNRLIQKGSRVLDPFGGSGTTARALVNEHAEVVCIERDASYCDLARRLFEQWRTSDGDDGQMTLL